MKKEILSHTLQKWQSLILDFSKNLESYLVLDWILWDRQWVFNTISSFTWENMNFSQFIQITKSILFFISSSNLIKFNRMKCSRPTHNIKHWSTTLKNMNCLLKLTKLKSIFHFYTPWEHKKQRFLDVLRRYGNGTMALKW